MISPNDHRQFIASTDAAHYRETGAWSDEILYDMLAGHALKNPHREAIVDPPNTRSLFGVDPQRLSWHTLKKAVDGLTLDFHQRGIGRGDIVITQLGNTWATVACFFAITRLGGIVSPLSLQSRRSEIAHAVTLLKPQVFLALEQFGEFNPIDYFHNCFPDFAGLVLPVNQALPDLISGQAADTGPLSAVQHWAEADDIATICWTSGTEGSPKAVPRSHNNWRASAIGVSDGFLMTQAPERIMLPFPLINTAAIGGVTMPWLYNGGTLVLHHPFNIDVFAKQIIEEEITTTLASPTALKAMLASPTIRAAGNRLALRAVGCGSAAPSAALLSHYEEVLGIHIHNMFGANEGTLLCCDRSLVPDAKRRATHFPRVGYSGETWPNRAANWLKSKLIDPDSDQEVTQTGTPGILAVKGPSLFPGYYTPIGIDRSSFTEDGFYVTGDLFEIDSDQKGPRLLKVIGRKKEIVIRGGFNISPLEVDSALAELPGVVELATAGIVDDEYGERLCLYVVLEPNQRLNLTDVQAHLTEVGLAKTKWPERLVVVASLSRNALNKVVRSTLHTLPVITEEKRY